MKKLIIEISLKEKNHDKLQMYYPESLETSLKGDTNYHVQSLKISHKLSIYSLDKKEMNLYDSALNEM